MKKLNLTLLPLIMIVSGHSTASTVHDEIAKERKVTLSSTNALTNNNDGPLIEIQINSLRSVQDNLASGIQDLSFSLNESALNPLEVQGQQVKPGETINFEYLIKKEGQIVLPIKDGDEGHGSLFNYMLNIDNLQSILDYREVNPPARYTKVYDCPEGSTYNILSNQCLKPIQCTYDVKHLYAVSKQTGIRIVDGTSIINNANIKKCMPITKGQTVYTCSAEQTSNDVETLYGLCTNELIVTQQKHCPDSLHKEQPSTGYCEVPPLVECESGYDLNIGDNAFDSQDDKCVSQVFQIEKSCPDGYSLQGEQCEKTETTSSYYTCSSGTLSGTQCLTTTQSCSYSYSTYYAQLGDGNGARWNGSLVYSGQLPTSWWKKSSGVYYKRGAHMYSGSRFTKYQICRKLESTSAASLTCPSGYSLSGSQCTKVSTIIFDPTCPAGFELNGEKTQCSKLPLEMPAAQSCPSSYPVWDNLEKRCLSST